MQAIIIAIFSALGGTLLQLTMKFLGKEFIAPMAYLTMSEYAKTTATKYDDKIAQLVAKTWEIDPALLKD